MVDNDGWANGMDGKVRRQDWERYKETSEGMTTTKRASRTW